jgi:hypothetical protein
MKNLTNTKGLIFDSQTESIQEPSDQQWVFDHVRDPSIAFQKIVTEDYDAYFFEQGPFLRSLLEVLHMTKDHPRIVIISNGSGHKPEAEVFKNRLQIIPRRCCSSLEIDSLLTTV